jgi:hypothetical protein
LNYKFFGAAVRRRRMEAAIMTDELEPLEATQETFRSKAQKLAHARAVLAAWNRDRVRVLRGTKANDPSAESASAASTTSSDPAAGWR